MDAEHSEPFPVATPPTEPTPPTDPSGPTDFTLSPADAARVDALFDTPGFDPALLENRDPAHALLALLGTPVAREDRTLVDVACARVARQRELDREPVALHPADEEALDAYLRSGGDLSRVPSSLRDRAQRHAHLHAALLAGASGEPMDFAARSKRIDAVVSAVADAADRDARPIPLEARRSGLSNLRLRDLVSLAAMLLIASAVAIPVLGSARASARQAACESNLLATANALGVYAGSYRSALPVATAGFGGTWMNVGSTPDQSNSANLYTLVRTDHARLADLACPGNEVAPTVRRDPAATDWRDIHEVSYSYRVTEGYQPLWRLSLPGPMRVAANPARVVVLADRSPVTLKIAAGDPADPFANSPNHGGRGQHVLFADGSVGWTTDPRLESGDNIWLPRPVEAALDQARRHLGLIRGSELPATPEDAFLGP